MLNERINVMSLAGFDPSAGAGILADVKCFEQHQVYGFGICTSLTVQTDCDFIGNHWIDGEQIIAQLKPLLNKFEIKACKIGLIKDLAIMEMVVKCIKDISPDIKIIVDPILRASAGFEFHNWQDALDKFRPILKVIDLITPNYLEMLALNGGANAEQGAQIWALHCPVFLKGGHNPRSPGTDYLYENNRVLELTSKMGAYAKHGSGCVLSSAITANLALGFSLPASCELAKTYISKFLNSNQSLLGYHYY
jgi:hydroxymethylpyrimidine/phosphomethylpyrimidine kinase